MSAPHNAYGKIILLGEHAVVHGVAAIAAGISRGATAMATAAAHAELTLGSRRVGATEDTLESRAFRTLLEHFHAGPLAVHVDLDLPLGVGLGSSAAAGVAVARAIAHHQGLAPGDADVLEAANLWEDVFHGKASGIDAAAACLGGCLIFQRGQPIRPLTPPEPLHFVVAVAGPAASTKKMVAQVAQYQSKDPQAFANTLEGIGTLVRNAEQAILHADLRTLGKLMDLNQMLLAGWFLSTPEIEDACRAARASGALGAKLTGAGGGGCVIALVQPGDEQSVLDAWSGSNLQCFAARVEARTGPVQTEFPVE